MKEETNQQSIFRLSRYNNISTIGNDAKKQKLKKKTNDRVRFSSSAPTTSTRTLSSSSSFAKRSSSTSSTLHNNSDKRSNTVNSSSITQSTTNLPDENFDDEIHSSSPNLSLAADCQSQENIPNNISNSKKNGDSVIGKKRSRTEVLESIRLITTSCDKIISSTLKVNKRHRAVARNQRSAFDSKQNDDDDDDDELRRLERAFFDDDDGVKYITDDSCRRRSKTAAITHTAAATTVHALRLHESDHNEQDDSANHDEDDEERTSNGLVHLHSESSSSPDVAVPTFDNQQSTLSEQHSSTSMKTLSMAVPRNSDIEDGKTNGDLFEPRCADEVMQDTTNESDAVCENFEAASQDPYRATTKIDDGVTTIVQDDYQHKTFDLQNEVDFLFIRSDQRTATIKTFTKSLEVQIGRKLDKDERKTVKERLVSLVNQIVLPQPTKHTTSQAAHRTGDDRNDGNKNEGTKPMPGPPSSPNITNVDTSAKSEECNTRNDVTNPSNVSIFSEPSDQELSTQNRKQVNKGRREESVIAESNSLAETDQHCLQNAKLSENFEGAEAIEESEQINVKTKCPRGKRKKSDNESLPSNESGLMPSTKPKRQPKGTTAETKELDNRKDNTCMSTKTTATLTDDMEDGVEKNAAAPRPRKRARAKTCALCRTCPCQKSAADRGQTEQLDMASSFSRSDAAVEKALIRRFQKLEKSSEHIAEQKEIVRRNLKKHRRDIWKRQEKENATEVGRFSVEKGVTVPIRARGPIATSEIGDDAWFLPDAQIFEQQQAESVKTHSNLVKKAQLVMYSNVPLKQPSLLQMGFSREKPLEASEPSDLSRAEDGTDHADHSGRNDGDDESCDESSLNAIKGRNEGDQNEADDEICDELYVRDQDQNESITRSSWNYNYWEDGLEKGRNSDVTWITDAMMNESWPKQTGDPEMQNPSSFFTSFDKLFHDDDPQSFGNILDMSDYDAVEDDLTDHRQICENECKSPEDAQDVPISLSMLSQGAREAVKDMWSDVEKDKEKLARLQKAVPEWKENIAFSFHQKDTVAIEEALTIIREKRHRMNIMKKLLFEAWEREDTALEVFEETLASSATRARPPLSP